jgi:hypothetical protein
MKAIGLFRSRGAETGCRLGLDVGYAFAVHAGALRRAPGWMRRAGTEWLWRLLQDPLWLTRRYLADALALPGLAWRASIDRLRPARGRATAVPGRVRKLRLPILEQAEEPESARIQVASGKEWS